MADNNSVDPAVVIWLGVPFAVAALLAALLSSRVWHRTALLIGLGVALGLLLIAYAYLTASREYDVNGCSECGEYLGRYWEPFFVVALAAVGLVSWMVGIGVGGFARLWWRELRDRRAEP